MSHGVDELILPDPIPCALTPNGGVVHRTCYTKEECFFVGDLLKLTTDGSIMLDTHDERQRVLALVGLPVVGEYEDGSDCKHPYYSLESLRTSQKQRTVPRTTGVLAVPGRLAELMAQMGPMGKRIKAHVAQRPTLVLGRSGLGKTSLLCVLAERHKLPDAALSGAVSSAGSTPREQKALEGRRHGCPTLENFEVYATSYTGQGTARSHARLLAGIRKFESQRIADDAFMLKGRGPFVSLGPGESDHTSNVPMLIEASSDLRFRVKFSCITQEEAATAVAACVREHNQTPELDNPNESKQAKQGADLLGFIDGRMPARLNGVPPAAWTLVPQVDMFLGCTFEWSYLAASWEEGKARMHDVLFDYTVGPWSPWSTIRKEGVLAQLPLYENTSPWMDAQGALDDGSGRDQGLQELLERVKFHAYIIFVDKQLDQSVIHMLRESRVLAKALKEKLRHELSGTPEGRLEAQPPSVMVVRVSDLASALVNASPEELRESVDAQQELMPDKFRRDLTKILDDPAEPPDNLQELVAASCERFVKFFSVSTMRQPPVRMDELSQAIECSYKGDLKAQCRALAHAYMQNGVDELNALDSVRQAGGGPQRDLAVCRAETVRLLAECEAALATPSAPTAAPTLGDRLGTFIDDYVLTELLEGLDASFNGVSSRYSAPVFLGYLADEKLINMPPGGGALHPDHLDGRVGSEQATLQGKLLKSSSDLRSPLLAACLRPARQALARFEDGHLAKFVNGDCAAWAWDLAEDFLLKDAFMSHECKEVMEALKNTKAPPPGMLRTFLLAKALRDALHDALMRMQRMLGILNLGNLMHATQRCGIAKELFITVAAEVLKSPAARMLPATAAACVRYKLLSEIMAGTRDLSIPEDSPAFRPGFERSVMYFLRDRLHTLLTRTKEEVVKDALMGMRDALKAMDQDAIGAGGNPLDMLGHAADDEFATDKQTDQQKDALELKLKQISALLAEHGIASDESIFDRVTGGIQATDEAAKAEQKRHAVLRNIMERHSFRNRRITRSLGLKVDQLFTWEGLARYELMELAITVLEMTPPIKDSTDRLRIKLREALKLLKPEELQAKDAPGSDRKGKKPRLA